MDKSKRARRLIFLTLKFGLLTLFAWSIWSIWPAIRYTSLEPQAEHRLFPYLRGAYHMHTQYSDGYGGVKDVVKEAKEAGLDWIIVCDHGDPNLKSQAMTGWFDGLLVIGASELSTDAGHLVVIGASSQYRLPLEPQLAVDLLEKEGGMTFIAHPHDDKIPWTDWSIQDYTGLEVFSAYENVKSAMWYRIVQFPLQYGINSKYAILNLLSSPSESLATWDKMNQSPERGQKWGIFATDAHGRVPITSTFDLPIPNYYALMATLQVYIPGDRVDFKSRSLADASAQILSAIRTGHFFNVTESMASAEGVKIEYLLASGSWRLHLSQPYPGVILKLYRSGRQVIERIIDPGNQEIPLEQPGRYRIELYLSRHPFPHLPWLVGNPVDLPEKEETASKRVEQSQSPRLCWTIPSDGLGLEKNTESYGELRVSETTESLTPFATFRYSLRIPSQGNDSWCSLTVRDEKTLQSTVRGGEGLYIEMAANKKTTAWVEIRTTDGLSGAELWYRHSVHVGADLERIQIPFDRMKQIHGPREPLCPERITALFLSVNSSTSFIPDDGELYLYQLGGYKDSK